jgi:hypothetical protein
MEYPGSIFNHFWRRALLFLFIFVFLTITPGLVFYTIGYRYDTTYGILKKTGALSIDVLPKTATVYVNNQNVGKKLPLRFPAISKGTYQVHITADGYYDWQKDVEVKDQETTYIRDVDLIKKSNPESLQSGTVDILTLSLDGNFLIYSLHTSSSVTTFFYNTQTRQTTRILSNSAATPLSALWSLDQHFVILIDKEVPFKSLVIIPTNNPRSFFNLVNLSSESIIKVSWRETAAPELYYETTLRKLYSFNPLTKNATFLKDTHGIQDWTVNNDEIWTLSLSTSTNHLVITKDFLITPQEVEILEQPEITNLSLPDWHFKKIFQNTVALQHGSEQSLVLLYNKKIFTVPAAQLIISPYQNWWLFWNSYELWSYHGGEAPKLLTRSGDHLQNVIPIDEFNTLLLMWQDKNTILYPYYFVAHDFLESPLTAGMTDVSHRILYFTGKIEKKDGLWKIKY